MNLQDHLHIRGEYADQGRAIMNSLGSPPHTWRILKNCRIVEIFKRITSTYVENTTNLAFFLQDFWDHLHIRGEYCWCVCWSWNVLGSPPHTWRIPSDDYGKESAVGITSTYVENTIDCFN